MASLSSGLKLGSPSSLIKSAASLQTQLADYNDSLQSFQYSQSSYTDSAFGAYQKYLNDRIKTLNSTGTLTDAQKALSLTRTLQSAMKSNISGDIQRENIQILAGNASDQDKYNLISNQYMRAVQNGDLTLAQSLESQAYSLSQKIQYDAQQSASARSALQTALASGYGQMSTNLIDSIKYFNGLAKKVSGDGTNAEAELNQAAKNFADANNKALAAFGVKITSQPNYFDVVAGIVGAAYNQKVLQAQAENSINPLLARNYAMQAQNMIDGNTNYSTLAGDISFAQMQAYAANPQALSFSPETGTYKQTTQVGFQYQDQILAYDQNGQPVMGKVLVPQFSGIVGGFQTSRNYYLTPNETKAAINLGLQFTQTDIAKEVNKGEQVGVGVTVQATNSTPDWLKNILGQGGNTKLYSDANGNITFGTDLYGNSGRSYTLMSMNGLHALYENTPDGGTKIVGGDYGFNQGAAQLLLSQAQQVQTAISIQQKAAAMQLAQSKPLPLPSISVPKPSAPPRISVPRVSAPAITPPTINPQRPTVNPQQPGNINLQGGSINLQGGGGISLQ